MAAFANAETRAAISLEALRATFAGLIVFGGAFVLAANAVAGAVYVLGWAAYGSFRYVAREMETAGNSQRVLATIAAIAG